MQRYFISHCVLRLISGREHHVSDYLLTGIEGCGDKDQACFFVAYHDDSGRSGCSSNHGVYSRYYREYADSISHTVSMLWGDWRVCVIESPRSSLDKRSFSKIYPSFLTLKEGSTFLTKPLFPQGREDVTALRCSEPLRSKVGGASKPSPDIVRDGTALLKVEPACVGLTTACYNGIM